MFEIEIKNQQIFIKFISKYSTLKIQRKCNFLFSAL